MQSSDENDPNIKITRFTARKISNCQQHTISFRANSESEEDDVERNYKLIVGKVLNGRDTIVVTKEDRLIDLISINVAAADRDDLVQNALIVESFTLEPYTNVKHYATLVKKMPLSVAEDLGDSAEFSFGNLWFLVPPNDAGNNEPGKNVIDDIRKLSAYTDDQLPTLWHEAIHSPAMHDGLEILWFKPNEDVYEKVIKPLLEN